MAKLKLFAGLREAAGVREADIEAETVGRLVEAASRLYGPSFSSQVEGATIVVNGAEVNKTLADQIPVGSDDEVALLPPVSGGT